MMGAAVAEVVAGDEDGPADFADRGQGAQGDHLAPLVADLEEVDVSRLCAAVFALGLDRSPASSGRIR